MAKTLAVGTQIAIAQTYAASATFQSITNASEAVASFSSNPSLVVGDIIEVKSGWGRLNDRVVRVKAISGAGPYLVTLEGIDTTSTTLYPAGSGAGTVRKISAWQTITQISGLEIGDPTVQFADASDFDNPFDIRIPAGITPPEGNATVHYDTAPSWLATVRAAFEGTNLAAIRMLPPNGAKIYANAYWVLSEFPQTPGRTETLKQRLTFSFASLPTGYAS